MAGASLLSLCIFTDVIAQHAASALRAPNVRRDSCVSDIERFHALSAVDDLEKAMVESGNYYSVEITKRPLDIESDNQLTGNLGAGTRNNATRAEVAFRVVREVTDE